MLIRPIKTTWIFFLFSWTRARFLGYFLGRYRFFLNEFFFSWTLSWSSACFLERVRFSWTLSWTSACFLHRLLFFSWPSSFFLDWVLFFLVESVVNFLFTFFFSLIKPRLFSTLNFDWNIELFHLKYILKCEKKYLMNTLYLINLVYLSVS